MNYYKGTITIILLLIFTSAFCGEDFDIRIKAIKDPKLPDSTRIEYLSFLFYGFQKYDDDVALEYGNKLIKFLKEKSLAIDEKFEFDYGKSLIEFGHYNEGYKYANGLIRKYKSKENVYNVLRAESLIALQYYKKGYISKSISHYKKSIDFAIKNGYHDYAANTLYDLAGIYLDIGEQKFEFESLLKAYKNFEKSSKENTEYLIFIQHRLGNIYREKGKFKEALENFHKSTKLSSESNDTTWVLYNYGKIAKTYTEMGKIDTAMSIYKELIPMSISLNDSSILANSYGSIGSILYQKGQKEESLSYFSKAIEIAKKKNDIANLSWIYKALSEIWADRKDFKAAYNYYRHHTEYKGKLLEGEYVKKIGQTKLLYASEKKEKELEILSGRLYKNRLWTYGLGLGALLFIVFGGLLFHQSRQKNIQRLTEMNHKISEVTQKNLRQQMNPHFIFNTLNSIQYYMYQNDRISTNNYLTKFSSLMRKTLENSTHTSIPIKDEIEALQLYLQLEALRFKDKFKWEIKIDEEIDTLLYKMPTMLIQPYVENSICHGLSNKDESGYIHIDLKLKDKCIEVTIEDDGIGREKAQEIKKIKNGNHYSLGTKITESRLKLVNALYGNEMKIHYEDLFTKDHKPAGTRVIIDIPIIS